MMVYANGVGGADIMNKTNIKQLQDNYTRCIMCGRPISNKDYYIYGCRCKDCYMYNRRCKDYWRCIHNE